MIIIVAVIIITNIQEIFLVLVIFFLLMRSQHEKQLRSVLQCRILAYPVNFKVNSYQGKW